MPDTIAAIATPQLPSAIGILRLSGPDTRRILDVVFSPAHGGPVSGQAPRRMVLGDLHDRQGRIIDSALAVLFPGPHSYTGEDCAEIHCHGSPVVLNEGLDALFAQGARQAKGGEFTQRAFLNGRMDLIQAEAVADLIDAESPAAAHNAVGQLEGRLSRGVGEIYDGLMEVVSRFYAVVDYPDEDIDPLTQGQLTQTLARSETALEALLATFRRGQLLRQGVPAVILGKPNAGKSSLLNALLGYDRAIVTDVAGTTRDTVEEKVQVGHVLLRLCDTAGLRDTGDAVERLGVQRTRDAARQAALALLVLDGSRPLTAEDEDAIATAAAVPRQLVIVNKTDLPAGVELSALVQRFGQLYPLSAATGEGDSDSGCGFGWGRGVLPPHKEQESAGHSPLQPHDCHSAGVWALPWRGAYGLSLLHGNGYTAHGERLAAIYRKVQHAARGAKNFYSPVPPHIRAKISD